MPGAGYAGVLESNSLAGTATRIAGECTVVAVHAINTTAAAAYVQLFDAKLATDVTVGTTIPKWVVASPSSAVSADHGIPAHGIKFDKGVIVASTTTPVNSTGATQHVKVAIV